MRVGRVGSGLYYIVYFQRVRDPRYLPRELFHYETIQMSFDLLHTQIRE